MSQVYAILDDPKKPASPDPISWFHITKSYSRTFNPCRYTYKRNGIPAIPSLFYTYLPTIKSPRQRIPLEPNLPANLLGQPLHRLQRPDDIHQRRQKRMPVNIAPPPLLGLPPFQPHARLLGLQQLHAIQQALAGGGGRGQVAGDGAAGAQGAREDVEVHEDDGDGVAADGDQGVGVGGGGGVVGTEAEGRLPDGDEVVEEVLCGFDQGAVGKGVEGASEALEGKVVVLVGWLDC